MTTTASMLRAVAAMLAKGDAEKVEAAWEHLKKGAAVKALYRSHPDQLSAIVSFARMRARGKLAGGDAGYAEMTNKVAAEMKD